MAGLKSKLVYIPLLGLLLASGGGLLSYDAMLSGVSLNTPSVMRYLRSLPPSIIPKMRGEFDYGRYKLPGFYSLPSEYSVQEGDSWERITAGFGLPRSWLMHLNPSADEEPSPILQFGDTSQVIEIDPTKWVNSNSEASTRAGEYVLLDEMLKEVGKNDSLAKRLIPFQPPRAPTPDDFGLKPYKPGENNPANLHAVFIGDFLKNAGLEQILFTTETYSHLLVNLGVDIKGYENRRDDLGHSKVAILDYRGNTLKTIPITRSFWGGRTEVHDMQVVQYSLGGKTQFGVILDLWDSEIEWLKKGELKAGNDRTIYQFDGEGDKSPFISQALALFSIDENGEPEWKTRQTIYGPSHHPQSGYETRQSTTRFATKVRVINSQDGVPQFLFANNVQIRRRLKGDYELYQTLELELMKPIDYGFEPVKISDNIKVAELMEFFTSTPKDRITETSLRALGKAFGQDIVNKALELLVKTRVERPAIVGAVLKAYVEGGDPLSEISKVTGIADSYTLETLATDASRSFSIINERGEPQPITLNLYETRGSLWGLIPYSGNVNLAVHPWTSDPEKIRLALKAGGYIGGEGGSRLGVEVETTETTIGYLKAKKIPGTNFVIVDDAEVVDRWGNRIQETRETGKLDVVGTLGDITETRRDLNLGPDISGIKRGLEAGTIILQAVSKGDGSRDANTQFGKFTELLELLKDNK